jgi:hypothetical protein
MTLVNCTSFAPEDGGGDCALLEPAITVVNSRLLANALDNESDLMRVSRVPRPCRDMYEPARVARIAMADLLSGEVRA